MKEILKEIAPGVFTHSHWEDENGNIIEFTKESVVEEPTDAQVNMAILLDLYSRLEEKGVI